MYATKKTGSEAGSLVILPVLTKSQAIHVLLKELTLKAGIESMNPAGLTDNTNLPTAYFMVLSGHLYNAARETPISQLDGRHHHSDYESAHLSQ